MYLRHLYPSPTIFAEDESEKFVFGSQVNAYMSGLSADCAERVKALWKSFSFTSSTLTLVEKGNGFCFGTGEAEATLNDADTYSVKVKASGISVAARSEQGLMDGIKTLVQLICPVELANGKESFYISSAEIHDSPAIAFRAVHICIFPESKLYNIEKAIHLAGFLKMTHIILEFWGTFRYECLPELSWKDRSYSRSDLSALVDIARSYGMEIIPMVNHFGHASQSRSTYGRHVTLNSNPRFARLFEPDGWTWCLSNPDTYKLLSEMRAEMTEFCGKGSYFHLGFDEAASFATCDRCRKRVPHVLLAEFLNRLTDDLWKTGRRPIVWHDQFIRRSDFGEGPIIASGDYQNTAAAIDLLDRRIIIADWEYGYTDGFNVTTEVFIKKGFDTVICPWDNPENVISIANDVKRLNAYGIILTTWDHLPMWLKKATFSAEQVWNSNPGRFYSDIESAYILRTLYPTQGDYESSGWNLNEVLQ